MRCHTEPAELPQGRAVAGSVRHGATIMELLAVLLVIAVLAAFALLNVPGHLRAARSAGVREDAAALGTYLDASATVRGQLLPTNQTALTTTKTAYPSASPTTKYAIRSVSADQKGALLVIADATDSTRRCTLGVGSSARANPITCTF